MAGRAALGTEVPHQQVVRLFRQHGRPVLRHDVTGEKVFLDDAPWQLHFTPDGRFGYITRDDNGQSRWVNRIFCCSAWSGTHNEQIVKVRRAGGNAAEYLVGEWRGLAHHEYPEWSDEALEGAKFRAKVAVYPAPKDGALVYWQLTDVALSGGIPPTLLRGLLQRNCAAWETDYGIPRAHVIFSAREANAGPAFTMLSTRALLALLAHGASNCRPPVRGNCAALLQSILSHCTTAGFEETIRWRDALGNMVTAKIKVHEMKDAWSTSATW